MDRLEKLAAYAYQLTLEKLAADYSGSDTYAKEGLHKGALGGLALGASTGLYNLAAKGKSIGLVGGVKKSVATAVLGGLIGGLGGGAVERKPVPLNYGGQQYDGYR